jgi:hypothetical protein
MVTNIAVVALSRSSRFWRMAALRIAGCDIYMAMQ